MRTWMDTAGEAIAARRRQVREQPDNPHAWVALAMTLEDAWRDKEARSCYVKAIALAPDHKTLLSVAMLLRGLEHAPRLKPGSRPSGLRSPMGRL
jgi:Flp pilus assembly protein TadD